MPRARPNCSFALAAILVHGLSVCAAGQYACGDCNGDGVVSMIDALYAAQCAAGIRPLTPDKLARCDVAPPPGVDVLDALAIARKVVGLLPRLQCGAQASGFALFVDHGDFGTRNGPLFIDSFDSRLGSYSPAPAAPPWTTPYQDEQGALGSNSSLLFPHAANEIHGPISYGAGQTAVVSGVVSTAAQEQAMPWVPPNVSSAFVSSAYTTNDNASIVEVLDPMWYPPGQSAYSSWSLSLTVLGVGTRVTLGDPGGVPRLYYFSAVTVAVGAIVEIVGPVVIVMDGVMQLDGTDGIPNLISSGSSAPLVMYGTYQTQALGELELGGPEFHAYFYVPHTYVSIGPECGDLYGSLVCDYLDLVTPTRLAIHYDNALGALGAPP